MSNGTSVQISSVRATFLPDKLYIKATDPQTPFVQFDNGLFYVLQLDGNFVIYTGNGTPVWGNNANTKAKTLELRFQQDGNFVEYADGQKKWETGTAGTGKKLVLSDSTPYLTILDGKGNIAWSSTQK